MQFINKMLLPILGMLTFTGFLMVSYFNGGLFFDELLGSSVILIIVFFLRMHESLTTRTKNKTVFAQKN